MSGHGGRGGGKQFAFLEMGHTPHRPGEKTALRGQGGDRPGSTSPPPPTSCTFFSLTETPEYYTLMVDEEGFKGGGWAGERA